MTRDNRAWSKSVRRGNRAWSKTMTRGNRAWSKTIIYSVCSRKPNGVRREDDSKIPRAC